MGQEDINNLSIWISLISILISVMSIVISLSIVLIIEILNPFIKSRRRLKNILINLNIVIQEEHNDLEDIIKITNLLLLQGNYKSDIYSTFILLTRSCEEGSIDEIIISYKRLLNILQQSHKFSRKLIEKEEVKIERT